MLKVYNEIQKIVKPFITKLKERINGNELPKSIFNQVRCVGSSTFDLQTMNSIVPKNTLSYSLNSKNNSEKNDENENMLVDFEMCRKESIVPDDIPLLLEKLLIEEL